MTATFIKNLFETNKNVNFNIVTNIAVGKGINGVSYNTFMGKCFHIKNNVYGHTCMEQVYHVETTKVVEVNVKNNVLVIDYTNTDHWLSKGNVKRMYIDTDTIVSIEFFSANIGEWKRSTFIPKDLNAKVTW